MSPEYGWDEATSDLATCLALEADLLIRLGDWDTRL